MPLNIPPSYVDRELLHNEVHARPPARIWLPAHVILVVVLNDQISAADEMAHLKRLPLKIPLPSEGDHVSFLSLKLAKANLRWERHTEFSRYTLIQPLPESLANAVLDGRSLADALTQEIPLEVSTDWLQNIPGQTMHAMTLLMMPANINAPDELLQKGRSWFGQRPITASSLSSRNDTTPHSWAMTDFVLRDDGFEHFLIFSQADMRETRAGRTAQRLLDIETYRIMALRGYLVARNIGGQLTQAEHELAKITHQIDDAQIDDQQLLHDLVALAAKVEKLMTEHNYRFAATRAYETLIKQRLGEINERSIVGNHGMLSIGTFLQRRLSPAMATVRATASRLENLSQRINRNSELLSTRVTISTEKNNLELLAKLTRGQQLQLQLQSTVEGLSIVAISYYAISLILYAAKAAEDIGLPIKPEVAAGVAIPFVLYGTWRMIRKIHHQLTDLSQRH